MTAPEPEDPSTTPDAEHESVGGDAPPYEPDPALIDNIKKSAMPDLSRFSD